MPCNCDHMRSGELEQEVSRLFAIKDELDGKGPIDPKTFGNGYDKRAYNISTRRLADKLAKEVCSRLKLIGSSRKISLYSLELQIWWRDHQVADKKKINLEKQK